MNDSPPTNLQFESQHGRKEQLLVLWTKLRKDPLFQDALKAYRTLAAEGCDIRAAKAHLGRVAGYKKGNGRRSLQMPTGQAISRKIRTMNRQLRKLADRAAELRSIWGLWESMVDADVLSVPEELQRIAAKLSCVRTEGLGDWFPQRDAIVDLLELVQTTTGRAHYVEVSLLINAQLVWNAAKYGRPIPDMKFDPDSLKMFAMRHKQREAAKASKRAEVEKQLKSIESTKYPAEQLFGSDLFG